MHQLVIIKEVIDELETLEQIDVDAAAAGYLLLESLADNETLLEQLCVQENHYNHDPSFEVKNFVWAQRAGYSIWILKFRDNSGALPGFRFLIAFDGRLKTYYVLQLADRDTSYLPGSSSLRELLVRYDECGIPRYR